MARKPRTKKVSRPIPWGKWLWGFLLLVPCFVFSMVLAHTLTSVDLTIPRQLAFITGAGVYLVMHLLLWKPIFIHVMGHELTHAFWAVVLGGKIKSLLVSQEGGQVTISKTNFFIALAPYFFPIYTFILLPIYLIAAKPFHTILAFLLGFTLAFHVALTLHSLKDEQSDIRQVGMVFSFPFIYVMNILVLVIVLSVVAPEMLSFLGFLKSSWQLLLALIVKLGHGLLFIKTKVL